MNKKKFYVTTSIPYVNSIPHVGTAMEFVQGDAIARYRRLIGNEVFFQTGTDDHGQKNYTTAIENGEDPQAYVDRHAEAFKKLHAALNISYDRFIRTSDQEVHWPGVEKFWSKLLESGDVYKGEYEGLYCVGCERFLTEAELVDGKCPLHPNREPQILSEETYFFRYSKYVPEVIKLIESGEFQIIPGFRKKEMLEILRSTPGDVSFTRLRDKLPWGIPVPNDKDHVIYVWADALVNYLTGVGYGRDEAEFEKWWPADVHVIGKDILRFHAGLWLAMLLSAKLPLPKTVFVHGFVELDGEKISKSLGNGVDPIELIEKYSADALRYFLLREGPSTSDIDFTIAKFEARYNADLANGLGNLVSRVANLAEKVGLDLAEVSKPLLDNQYRVAVEDYRFNDALSYVWAKIAATDKLLTEHKPWEKIESDPEEAKEVIRNAALQVREIGELLLPFLPTTAERVLDIFAGPKIVKVEALFPRLEKS